MKGRLETAFLRIYSSLLILEELLLRDLKSSLSELAQTKQ